MSLHVVTYHYRCVAKRELSRSKRVIRRRETHTNESQPGAQPSKIEEFRRQYLMDPSVSAQVILVAGSSPPREAPGHRDSERDPARTGRFSRQPSSGASKGHQPYNLAPSLVPSDGHLRSDSEFLSETRLPSQGHVVIRNHSGPVPDPSGTAEGVRSKSAQPRHRDREREKEVSRQPSAETRGKALKNFVVESAAF